MIVTRRTFEPSILLAGAIVASIAINCSNKQIILDAGAIPNVALLRSDSEGACMLLSDRTLQCWGDNSNNELGLKASHDSRVHEPTPLPLEFSVQQVVFGGFHGCALSDEGRVTCWGGAYIPLLPGEPKFARPPTEVAALTDVRMLAAGAYHTCALDAAGVVRCWGSNQFAELGISQEGQEPVLEPAPVVDLGNDVVSIAAGSRFTCAQRRGDVVCWGDNTSGQLGDGTTERRSRPVKVQGLEGNVVKLALGGAHSCSLDQTGTVQCWGSGFSGETGQGNREIASSPSVVELPDPAVDIAAGDSHTCAVTDAGELYCWGENAYGQLGVNDNETCDGDDFQVACQLRPVKAAVDAEVERVFAGGETTCVRTTGAEIRCRGALVNDFDDELDRFVVISPTPVE